MSNNVNTWDLDMYPIVTMRFQDKYEQAIAKLKSTIGYETLKNGSGLSKQFEGIGGYGYIPDYDGTVTELNQKRGFKKVYTPVEKAAKVIVSKKYAITDQSGEAKRVGSKLSKSATQTMIRDFYNLFAYGWNTSYLGGDSKPLFSATHPVNNETGSDTFSNTGTSELSVSAITTAQTTAQRFVTYDGLPFDCDMDLVLVSPELEPKCRELFGKEAKLIPESAENGANPVYDMRYVVIKGFTAKQWAVADSMLLKEMMKCIVLTEPQVQPPFKVDPLNTDFTVYMDYVMGWSDARMIIGSDPA